MVHSILWGGSFGFQCITGPAEAGVQGVPGHTQCLPPYLIKSKLWKKTDIVQTQNGPSVHSSFVQNGPSVYSSCVQNKVLESAPLKLDNVNKGVTLDCHFCLFL